MGIFGKFRNKKGALRLHREQLVGFVMFVQDWPGEPPGGADYALEVFKAVNPKAFDLLARFPSNWTVEVRNLRMSAQKFPGHSVESAGKLLNKRFPNCSLVLQPLAVIGPSKSHEVLLCSYFRTDKKNLVPLEQGASFDLE